MRDAKNDKKIESIFAITEVRGYIANVIDENVKKFDLPIGEFEWSLAFLETYKKHKIGNDRVNKKKQNHLTKICNYIINNSGQSTFIFLREFFRLIALLEKDGIIESSEKFTGEMFAWILDPARSYLSKNARDKIIEDIQYIFRRYGRDIVLDPISRRYIFKKIPLPKPIDKNAIYLYGNSIFILDKTFNYIEADSTINIIDVRPAYIRIFKYLVGSGKGNINNWLKKEDIANNLELSSGTVSNAFSFFRVKIYKIIGIDLIEESGKDNEGKKYRINPKVLP
jgi:hypothetical protein